MRTLKTLRRTMSVLVATLLALGVVAGAALASTTIEAKALDDHGCDASEWHFVITGVRQVDPPSSITVTWSNGDVEEVALDRVPGNGRANVAHYATTTNLDVPVVSATAEIGDGWRGQFNLSHGPCGLDEPGEPGEPDDPEIIEFDVTASSVCNELDELEIELVLDNRGSNVAVTVDVYAGGDQEEVTVAAGERETIAWTLQSLDSFELMVAQGRDVLFSETYTRSSCFDIT